MSNHVSEQVLNAYLDDELKGNEKKSVQLHLEACAECRTKLEGLSALVSHLGSLPREAEPSSELWPAIARRTRRTRPKHRQPAIGIWRQLAFTAVVLLAAATGASVFRMYITADQAPEEEPPQATTVQAIAVLEAGRLELDNPKGMVQIEVWDWDSVSVASDAPGRAGFDVVRSPDAVAVRAIPADNTIDKAHKFHVKVPPELDLVLTGKDCHFEVTGSNGRIRVEVESGPIRLTNVYSNRVDVSTADGHIDFEGAIVADGHYRFATRQGHITLKLPAVLNATVRVMQKDGAYESDFEAVEQYADDSSAVYTIGSGGATLELEVIKGDITLRSPSVTESTNDK